MKTDLVLSHLRQAWEYAVGNRIVQENIEDIVTHIQAIPKERISTQREEYPIKEVVLTYTLGHPSPFTIYYFRPTPYGTRSEIVHFSSIDEAVDILESHPKTMRRIDHDTFIDLNRRKELKYILNREEIMFKEWLKKRKEGE